MATSAKTEKPNSTEEWTIVLPRSCKHGRNFPKIKSSVQQQQQQLQQQQQQTHWAPTDLETDPDRESRLMQEMQFSIAKLENSQFFGAFLDQIQSPELSDHFLKVLSSEPKMQMVIYGIGSIESFESPRFQLSLAILMKRKLGWIGDIEVFDPIISLTESRVLEGLGCSVLSVNEQGRRQALKPILFFMPHCEVELYDNLLQANWSSDLLNRIVLFGNSFETYEQQGSLFKHSIILDSRKHLLAVKRFTKEFEINTISDDYFLAFQGSSLHFFSVDPEAKLQFIKL